MVVLVVAVMAAVGTIPLPPQYFQQVSLCCHQSCPIDDGADYYNAHLKNHSLAMLRECTSLGEVYSYVMMLDLLRFTLGIP